MEVFGLDVNLPLLTKNNTIQKLALDILVHGHFTHEPKVVIIKLWEPKISVQRPSQNTSKIM
jgi:hypothetical protein